MVACLAQTHGHCSIAEFDVILSLELLCHGQTMDSE